MSHRSTPGMRSRQPTVAGPHWYRGPDGYGIDRGFITQWERIAVGVVAEVGSGSAPGHASCGAGRSPLARRRAVADIGPALRPLPPCAPLGLGSAEAVAHCGAHAGGPGWQSLQFTLSAHRQPAEGPRLRDERHRLGCHLGTLAKAPNRPRSAPRRLLWRFCLTVACVRIPKRGT
jgi:hypothetical protein